MNKKVRVGKKYIFESTLLDKLYAPIGSLEDGDIVKVINKYGCPKANTMGMCYVEKNGDFMGMVCTNSLKEVK